MTAPTLATAHAAASSLPETPARTSPAQASPSGPGRSRGQGQGQGHGARLTAAFEALERFPALAESRNRVLTLVSQDRPSTADVVTAVESDVALVIAVMRMSNNVRPELRGRVENIVEGVEVLSPEAVQQLASQLETFDFFERGSAWDTTPERFRLHAVAVQRAADRLACETGYPNRDRLLVTALLHDIGKLVLMLAYPGYPRQILAGARTPEERLRQERRELGIDHALVGGVLARRWRLPTVVASAIERHHASDADGEAAWVRLADLIAHYNHSGSVTAKELLAAARAAGLTPVDLRGVLYELSSPGGQRPRAVEPCPLSARELDVLKRLAQGMVYKQIALELSLSTSTVRTHLHNIYGKLGAVDRAQAVLMSTERGWL